MATRQEQFELDRQKMLASIGAEPDEPRIEVEKKVESTSVSKDMVDYEEKLDDLKADKPSLEEYKARACNAFEEKCDFESSLKCWGNTLFGSGFGSPFYAYHRMVDANAEPL